MKRNPNRRVTVEREVEVRYVVVNWEKENGQWVWSSQMTPSFEKRKEAERLAKLERAWFCKPAKLPAPAKGARRTK